MSEKISVIIPAYNAEKFINRCIQSVCQQSYPNFEAIFIDDGSSDHTGVLLDEAVQKDNRLKVIHQKNGGVSSARNAGLKNASGTYAVFVDADDTIEKNYFEKLIHAVTSEQAQIAICGFHETDLQGNILKSSHLSQEIADGNAVIEKMLQFRNITSALWNKIFLLDIIHDNEIIFHQEFAIGEDMVFLTEYCLHVQKAVIISDCLYCYTANPNGAMLSKNKKQFQEKWLTEWYAVKETERLLDKHHISSKMIVIKKIRIADKLLSNLTKSGNDNKVLQNELQTILKKNISIVFQTKDFSLKKKIHCMMNAVSPKLLSKLH